MPRRKVYPRFQAPDGRTYLRVAMLDVNGIPLSGNESADDVARIYKKLKQLIEQLTGFFTLDTKRQSYLFPVLRGWAFCVDDVMENVMDYKWLERKASKYIESSIKIALKEAQLAESGHERPAKEG